MEMMDNELLVQVMQFFEDKVYVLMLLIDLILMDLVIGQDIECIIEVVCVNFEYVIIDMLIMVIEWLQVVLELVYVYFVLIELDMWCVQNILCFKCVFQGEDLLFDKLCFVLNCVLKFIDFNGKVWVKCMVELLGILIDVMMLDGGKQVI